MNPTVAQMVTRSNTGHLRLLRAYRDDSTATGPATTDASIRGLMTALRTLRRWGCVEGDALTDTGRDLLARLEARDAKARQSWSVPA